MACAIHINCVKKREIALPQGDQSLYPAAAFCNLSVSRMFAAWPRRRLTSSKTRGLWINHEK